MKTWSLLLMALLGVGEVLAQEVPPAPETSGAEEPSAVVGVETVPQEAADSPASIKSFATSDISDLAVALNRMRKAQTMARVERHRLEGKENNLFFTIATGFSSYDQRLTTFKLEYSRQIKGNLYWGCNFSANLHSETLYCYDSWDGCSGYYNPNSLAQNIYKFDGMVFYRFPVVRSRLFFRVGTGIGVGYHRITEAYFEYEKDKVRPYFNFDAAWILRITKGFEMKFAPLLVIVPSEFAVSPVKLGASTDVVPWIMDAGFTLTMGCRF